MFYDLAASTWGPEEEEAAIRVIRSGRTTMGEYVERFEEAFATYHGMKHAIMVNSGSSANLIAIAALYHGGRVPPEAEVLVPTLSWATTYYPLVQYGIRPRFIDIELQSLNMDVELLPHAITEDTCGIIGVSILGNPARLDVMAEFANANKLWLMEDNCESLDAWLGAGRCGTFGDINTFSFFFSHHISTMEGGMILTDDDTLADLCRCLRAHGWVRDLKSDKLYQRGADHFNEAYHFILPGYNVRPLEISAAIGLEQLKKLPSFTMIRRQNLALFKRLFEDSLFYIQEEPYLGRSSAFAFTLIPKEISRERCFDRLRAAGIGFRMITGGSFLKHPVAKLLDYSVVDGHSTADRVHEHGFFVGNHPFDLSEQIHRLKEVLTW